ncbi:MAG: ribonuclease P protein component [Pseudobdellovibrionaceae bacterium]|nr:ribonuclease P protein component [Bdellovibrionales bacterium]USN46847.1 MAG: ribonuclease P protein component [Pseudobdellovibrionaceae bacterium]
MENKKPISIKSRSEFLELKKNGKHFCPTPWLLINYRSRDNGHLKFGMTVPKYVGNAVVRNRIKRWCRESVKRQGPCYSLDVNFVFRKREKEFYRSLTSKQIFEACDRAFSKLERYHTESN